MCVCVFVLKHLLTWRIRHLSYGQPTCSHAERCQPVCHLHTDCSGPPCPTEPLFPSHTQLPNFQSIRVECFNHSLIDPFNGARRPEQTHSFMGFQKCKWSIFLILSQGFLAAGLRPAAAGRSLTRGYARYSSHVSRQLTYRETWVPPQEILAVSHSIDVTD